MVWSGYTVLMSGKTDSIKLNNNPSCLPGSTFVYSEVFKLDLSSASLLLGSSHHPSFIHYLKDFLERITKKRTKNKAKTTKPGTEWKSCGRQSQSKAKDQKSQSQSQLNKLTVKTGAVIEEYYCSTKPLEAVFVSTCAERPEVVGRGVLDCVSWVVEGAALMVAEGAERVELCRGGFVAQHLKRGMGVTFGIQGGGYGEGIGLGGIVGLRLVERTLNQDIGKGRMTTGCGRQSEWNGGICRKSVEVDPVAGWTGD
ncbi:hypothetical protein Tco_0857169 [Tanacetum coccineum]|uniref:Uncharacterized protein n=1 Tax=Tanacetum coccineum TaxID=301880 RepID=A0ABQ5B7L4_9ASTR